MNEIPKTLAEIEALPGEVLTCKQVSYVLAAGEMWLHKQAIEDKSKLDFPVIVYGTRVKIPKQPFLKYMRGEA